MASLSLATFLFCRNGGLRISVALGHFSQLYLVQARNPSSSLVGLKCPPPLATHVSPLLHQFLVQFSSGLHSLWATSSDVQELCAHCRGLCGLSVGCPWGLVRT